MKLFVGMVTTMRLAHTVNNSLFKRCILSLDLIVHRLREIWIELGKPRVHGDMFERTWDDNSQHKISQLYKAPGENLLNIL